MVPVPGGGAAPATSATGLVETLVRMHGEAARPRAERGVKQVAAFWRAEDGDAAALQRFVTSGFIANPAVLARTRDRLAEAFEAADGHLLEIARTCAQARTSTRARAPHRRAARRADPGAHLTEDLFASKVAFPSLLNFPLDHARRSGREGRGLVAGASGPRPGSPAGSRAASAGAALAGARAGQPPPPSLHRRVQHLDAPRARRRGPAPVPEGHAAHQPLEPARRAQGGLRRRAARPGQAADDRAR